VYSNDKAIDMFNMMVDMNDDYYSSGRPARIDTDIIINDICLKIPLTSSDIFLDVGCGTGILTVPLSRRVKNIHALDAGDKVLKRLKINCKKEKVNNIKIHKGFVTKLPFKDKFFDKVIMYGVLHYLENDSEIQECIQELIRVCKQGGYILVADIPDKNAKIEFEKRPKTKSEIRILNEFKNNRKKFDKLYKKIVESHSPVDNQKISGLIDADLLVNIVEKEGCTSTILKQDIRQPFSLTRRDLVISLP